jgi:shikimate dehydrogenase
MITGRTRIAGVIGSPVRHSLSPLLMNSWIRAAGLDAAYIALPANPGFSAADLRALARSGLTGLNVTLPFKTLAAEIADEADAGVSFTGAANLLLFREDRISARNTDIAGINYALGQAGSGFRDARVLVLGAGGVARATLAAARDGGARTIVLANRTRQKADALAGNSPGLDVVNWADRQSAAEGADIIINATSLGMDGVTGPDINFANCRKSAIAFDTVYTPRKRPFTETAKAAGLQTIDGLAMLIGQAIPSFEALFNHAVPESVDAGHLLREALSS